MAGIESRFFVKSAALIVIGDEILTGKVKDENSFVFAKTMFDRGVKVPRIITIPDDISIIADVVAEFSACNDYVCTSGGVGPTHDDKTFAGIACAFNLPIHEHDEAREYFRRAQVKAGRGETISSAQMKMLRFPAPSRVYYIEPLWLPLVIVKNVHIFPGVPFLFEKMMTWSGYLFEGEKFFRETVFTNRSESNIADDLESVQDQFPDVAIGSYPQMPGLPYNVMVTIEGNVEKSVQHVADLLLSLIDGRKSEHG